MPRLLATLLLLVLWLPSGALAQATSPSPTGMVQGFTVGTTSTAILPQTTRRVLWLHNPSTSASIWCAFGGTATVSGPGTVLILPMTSLLWGNGENLIVPGDAVNCIASAPSTPLTVEAY